MSTADTATLKPKRPLTDVLLIIDRSGSMISLAQEVREGFNGYIQSLRDDKANRYRVTTTLFGTKVEILGANQKPKDVPVFDEKTYVPEGFTALYDAICWTVNKFYDLQNLGDTHRVLVVIQTDGKENASREHVLTDVTRLIAEKEASGNCTFLFHGLGPDAWETGQSIGTQAANTINTTATANATRSSYGGLSAGTRRYAGGAGGQSVGIAVADAAGEELRP